MVVILKANQIGDITLIDWLSRNYGSKRTDPKGAVDNYYL